MSKTTAPRVRATNLYTIEQDGQPVAQALAISQSEAIALWIASQQQPVLSARLSSPIEARTLAGLPLLSRGEPVRDEATPDLFDGVPYAPVADPVLVATYCPPVELPIKTYPPAVLAQIVAELAPDHVEDASEMVPPQHAPIAAVLEDLASGESAEPVALDASAETDPLGLDAEAAAIMKRLSAVLPGESVLSALSTAAPMADHVPAEAEQPTATDGALVPVPTDESALTARKSNAFHIGLELGKRGLKRFSAEMLMADADMVRGLPSQAADEAHCELLRGFEDGRASIGAQSVTEEPKGAGRVAAKYRNPETGESWSGRGLKPAWLRIAIDGGRTMDEFLI